MVRRAKFGSNRAYPSDLVVLAFRVAARQPEQYGPLQLGAVRLDRRTLEETASYESLIQPAGDGAFPDAAALRGTGLEVEALREAADPEEVLDGFEGAIFSGGEALSRARHRMILAAVDTCQAMVLLGGLLERSGRERNRYGERALDISSLYLYAQGIMGLKAPGSSLDLDAQLAAFGMARPAVRGALAEARLEAALIRLYQQLGVERDRAFEVASLDPDLLALVQDVEGRPDIKRSLRSFIQERTAASTAPPRTLRERLLRFAARGRAARAAGGKAAGGTTERAAPPGPRPPRRVRRHPPQPGSEHRM